MTMYGVITADGTHTDVSKTEKGAKRYATLHGYDTVTVRPNIGYVALIVAKKVNSKWVKL